MLVTEEEAKTKWCPFARKLLDSCNGRASYNIKDDDERIRCVASGCMAWRWNNQRTFPDTGNKGDCGLAGRPE